MFGPRLQPRREQVLLQICFGGRNYVRFTMALAGLGRREGPARERIIAIGRSHLKLSGMGT
jgi:hypothetical protein